MLKLITEKIFSLLIIVIFMISIFLLAIAGAVIAAVVGTFWYSDKTPMGKVHMKYLGFDKLSSSEQKEMIEKAKPTMWKTYLGQLVLSFLTAFAVVVIIVMNIRNGISFSQSLVFVFVNWLCFVVPTIGSGILWGTCERSIAWKKFFSDIFSNLVTLLLIAFLTSFFI